MTSAEAFERHRDAEERYQAGEAAHRELDQQQRRLDDERTFWKQLAELLAFAEAGTYPDPIPY